ncbi:chaoptin-like [Trichogramma pretiosum]|uniref:chaoptin-like n=1 Tax=Trichogramma pretiosum TaxID=7493 RepID=UPI0006C9A3E4|nr:chaoptin-like [Trichogramma pretiosum]
MRWVTLKLSQFFFLWGWIARISYCYDVACNFNAMCLCWVQDDADYTKMDISCTAVPFARFPDVSINYVAQLDVVGSGLQVFDNEALSSASGVEALGLMSNQLLRVGDKSLLGVSSSLRSLDLSYNSLEEIPLPALRGLRKLNWLNMHSNHLTTLEGDWGYVADTLSNAFFGDNSISAVPRSFSTFAALVWLNLDNNNMADLPEGVLPPNLVTLSLNLNLFESMPRSLASLAFLNWLYMRGNDIRRLELPQFASQELEMLDVSDNSIESISFSPGNNTLRIKDLNLSGNRLRSLARESFARVLVRRIHLSSNGMRSIDDGAFLGLEDSLEYLNLENNELGQLPAAVSSLHELAYLYLANNQIRELNNVSFAEFTSNLKALSLASNQLQVVPTNSLVGCSNLLHLNLGYNKIHKVEPGDFDWASSLEILLLRNNVLTQLKAQTFRGASKLKELSLSFNHLSDLSEETFVGLEDSLEILELSFAFSTDVFPQRALRPLSSLHWLVLDNNNFHAIEPTAFYTFQQLRYINLESNRLHYLPERIFLADVHAELRDVKLGYNFLESIPESTFHNLTELRALDLTGNKIRSLAADSVRNCPKLVTLSLANNRISSLDSAAFVALYGLRFLHLELNKLTALDFETFADSGGSDFTLNVSYNSISQLNPGISTINLTRLDLGFNNISQLSSDVFANTPNLKIINLQNNRMTSIEPGTFALTSLDTLNLRDNRLESLRKQSFNGLNVLQQLDLSGNQLSQLTNEQFRHLRNLRVLNLSRNKLRSLTRDVFTGTRLEILDVSGNKFTVIPSTPLLDVGYTLRSIDLSENFIDHLDSTSFPTAQLTYLNLARNRIQILPDNSFVMLSKLLSLNISQNHLRANFKEVFHYLPDLRQLSLANCGLKAIPHLQMMSLNYLDLSDNYIDSIRENELQNFNTLKVLLLTNNSLNSIKNLKLNLLRELDISENPIKELSRNTFSGFPRLERLNIRNLNRTRSVDRDCLKSLSYLKYLRTQTWPEVPDFRLRHFLSGLPLRVVEIQMMETELTDQLHRSFSKQLRELTITGQNLHFIAADAFATIEGAELVLRIKDTQVQKFQSDIFLSLTKQMSSLTLDLRNNHINELSPSVIYGNLSWESVGTNMVSGGLQLSGNPLECDCEIAWLSLWLRRWLRESRQIHTASQSDARQLRSLASRAVCHESTAQLYHVPDRTLLNLGAPNTACQASALSAASLCHEDAQRLLTVFLAAALLVLVFNR